MKHEIFNISGQVITSPNGTILNASQREIKARNLNAGTRMFQPESYPVPNLLFDNQVTDDGVKALLNALAATQSIKVTNIMLLNNFVLPAGKTAKTVTFADVQSFIGVQSTVGNNKFINPDNTMDMRVYVSLEEPFEMTCIATIPADKGNIDPTYNAAILVLQGDENQSVSKGTEAYNSVGTEVLFSLAQFDPQTKDNINPFALVWYITVQS